MNLSGLGSLLGLKKNDWKPDYFFSCDFSSKMELVDGSLTIVAAFLGLFELCQPLIIVLLLFLVFFL